MTTEDETRPPTDLPLLTSSGQVADELHVVHLRDAPDGTRYGLIRGDPPPLFVWHRVRFRRSAFTRRATHGALLHSYYVEPGPGAGATDA